MNEVRWEVTWYEADMRLITKAFAVEEDALDCWDQKVADPNVEAVAVIKLEVICGGWL